MTIDEILARLDELARVMRARAAGTPRAIDQQLFDAKAESYETAAGLVRRYNDGGNDGN